VCNFAAGAELRSSGECVSLSTVCTAGQEWLLSPPVNTEPADRHGPVQRLNVSVRSETYDRLRAARNMKGVEINVSAVADAAINAELDRLEKPGVADLVARLRVESDLRRGRPYSWGHVEGERWAREVASWAEICNFAMNYEERDVRIEVRPYEVEGFSGAGPFFLDRFEAPKDYDPIAPTYVDEYERQVDDPNMGEQYWRGWLAGVKGIFEKVKEELEPILPPPPGDPPVDVEF